MNIILFEQEEEVHRLPLADHRAKHLLEVLKIGEGTPFYVGRVNGTRGKASICSRDEASLHLTVEWEEGIEPLRPVALVCGLSRPQTMRKLLQETSALGVSRICLFQSERGEPSYASSKLWTSGEWRRHLLAGTEQAFHTHLPELLRVSDLSTAIDQISLKHPDWQSTALDVYEAQSTLTKCLSTASKGCIIYIGSERGWSPKEREALRSQGIPLAHLGERVLRTETACTAAISIALSRLGFL